MPARVDPLIGATQREVLDLGPRYADVPEFAVPQGVQGGPQLCTLAPLLKDILGPLEEGCDERRPLGGAAELCYSMDCGHGCSSTSGDAGSVVSPVSTPERNCIGGSERKYIA